jgi:predicted DCC family thiol-disulfide oxidoreductase YuxK
MIKVFYDAQCGLCRKEINYYKRIAPPGIFAWCDVHDSAAELESLGVTVTNALKLFHVLDNNGQLYKGVDAFIIIWQQLKYWRMLAYLIALPGIKQVTQLVYSRFAIWRFKRMPSCQLNDQK